MAVKVEKTEGVLKLSGVVDEHTNLSQDLGEIQHGAVLDLSSIERINSTGVKGWIQYFSKLSDKNLVYTKCSIAIVEQLNMVKSFACGAKVKSFLAPYICPSCKKESKVELDATSGLSEAPKVPCPHCKHPELEFDDLEEEYFSFLN